MKQTVRLYDVEGTQLEIHSYYDELAQMYIETYPDFIETPVYTKAGAPILFAGEDACVYGEPLGGEPCIDCGSCRFYRQTPNTLMGVCGHAEKQCDRKGREPEGVSKIEADRGTGQAQSGRD